VKRAFSLCVSTYMLYFIKHEKERKMTSHIFLGKWHSEPRNQYPNTSACGFGSA
jgi:hypothetical protein